MTISHSILRSFSWNARLNDRATLAAWVGMVHYISTLELSGESINSIKCYLTGEAAEGGSYSIRKLCIEDKHGLSHTVFNAKINIYRSHADPILLGIEDRMLISDDLAMVTTGHIYPAVQH